MEVGTDILSCGPRHNPDIIEHQGIVGPDTAGRHDCSDQHGYENCHGHDIKDNFLSEIVIILHVFTPSKVW